MLGLDARCSAQTALSLKTLKVVPTAYIYDRLSLPDKDCAIKGLFVCYVVWVGFMIYGMDLWTSVRCVSLFPGCRTQNGYRAQVLQHPIDIHVVTNTVSTDKKFRQKILPQKDIIAYV